MLDDDTMYLWVSVIKHIVVLLIRRAWSTGCHCMGHVFQSQFFYRFNFELHAYNTNASKHVFFFSFFVYMCKFHLPRSCHIASYFFFSSFLILKFSILYWIDMVLGFLAFDAFIQVIMVASQLLRHLDLLLWTYLPLAVIWICLLTSVITWITSLVRRRFLFLGSFPKSCMVIKVGFSFYLFLYVVALVYLFSLFRILLIYQNTKKCYGWNVGKISYYVPFYLMLPWIGIVWSRFGANVNSF